MPPFLAYLLAGAAPYAAEAVKTLAPEALKVLEEELLKVLNHVQAAQKK